MRMIWLLIPVLVGLVQPVLWQMNLRVARHTGAMEAAILLHIVGTVVGLGWWFGGVKGDGFAALGVVPWWAWLGGALGVTAMFGMNRAIPEIGVASALALTVAAQLGAALLFEHFGLMGALLRPAEATRWLGVVLLTLGAFLVTR